MKAKNTLVLDACCGSKMFWFDNNNPLTIFGDIREIETKLCDGRDFEVKPDVIFDFTDLPFDDNQFKLVSFDPPHLKTAGEKGWQAIKYGRLAKTWKDDLKSGFSECFRVLDENGMLVFKWNELQIKTAEILKLTEYKPMFGHVSGKRACTHWVVFMKSDSMKR
jgi:SAM-dependent methyltransferase